MKKTDNPFPKKKHNDPFYPSPASWQKFLSCELLMASFFHENLCGAHILETWQDTRNASTFYRLRLYDMNWFGGQHYISEEVWTQDHNSLSQIILEPISLAGPQVYWVQPSFHALTWPGSIQIPELPKWVCPLFFLQQLNGTSSS